MAELLEAWPAAVGPEIARNAWPARIARDGTVHANATDAIWAFELGQRAAEIAVRLGVPKLRFTAGPLPERTEKPEHTRAHIVAEPSPEDRERASAIAATVEDEGLRKAIERAAALSLASGSASRPF